jgi:phosphoribosylformylglycinamidine synthase
MCEAHLLPGALMRNARLTYASRPVNLRIERTDTPFTGAYQAGQVITLPVAHGEGRYVADEKTLAELEATGRVVVRYVAPDGGPAGDGDNPNGSIKDIAGICNAEGNLVGLMPHPDRMTDPTLGLTEGAGILRKSGPDEVVLGTEYWVPGTGLFRSTQYVPPFTC